MLEDPSWGVFLTCCTVPSISSWSQMVISNANVEYRFVCFSYRQLARRTFRLEQHKTKFGRMTSPLQSVINCRRWEVIRAMSLGYCNGPYVLRFIAHGTFPLNIWLYSTDLFISFITSVPCSNVTCAAAKVIYRVFCNECKQIIGLWYGCFVEDCKFVLLGFRQFCCQCSLLHSDGIIRYKHMRPFQGV
jgi:hypothetical protein